VISEKQGKNKIFRGASTLSLLSPNKHSRAIAVNKAGHVAIGTNDGELSIRTTSVNFILNLGLECRDLGIKNIQGVDRGRQVLT
jgi:hypothetical protein